MNVWRSLKTKLGVFTSSETNRKVSEFVDKHRVIQKALVLGIGINAYFCYTTVKKLTALKLLQEYIETRQHEIKQRYSDEAAAISETLRENPDSK